MRRSMICLVLPITLPVARATCSGANIRSIAVSGHIEQNVHYWTARSICLLTKLLDGCPIADAEFSLMSDGLETSPMHSPGSTTSQPRWVKAFGIAAIL